MNVAEKLPWSIGKSDAPLPPLLPGIPILGSGLKLFRDPIHFIVDNYHDFGPIYRARVLDREIYFLSGSEANELARREDENIFTNARMFNYLEKQIGPGLASSEPEAHAYMRRQLRPAYSRTNTAKQIETLTRIVDDFFDELEVGESFDVFTKMQEVVSTQLSYVMLNMPPGGYFPEIRTFMKTILEVDQFRTRPRWFYTLPFYKNARARTMEMAQTVIDHLRATKTGEDRSTTVLDILMNSNDIDGNPYSEAYLVSAAIGPFLAGSGTIAGTLSFLFYMAHKFADVQERISKEARDIFSPDMPIGDLRNLDDIHKVIKETMRLYPIGGFMPRHARKEFEFHGYRVPADSIVYSVTSVVHFLPENYESPFTFDIDRPPGPAGTFVPYGVGNYTCLAAGIADIQLMITMAALLRRGRFQLDPEDYELKLTTMPVPNPGKYKLKLVERYNA